ncbi:hypothetical protein HKD37_01G000708 [Glycine soja]
MMKHKKEYEFGDPMVMCLHSLPRNRIGQSYPCPCGARPSYRGILQAPPLLGHRASLPAMRPQPQTAMG